MNYNGKENSFYNDDEDIVLFEEDYDENYEPT